MKKLNRWAGAFLLFTSFASAAWAGDLKNKWLKNPSQWFLEENGPQKPLLHFETFTLPRRLNASSNETFDQRVFFSSTFASGPGAPVILYICGEWECGESEIEWVAGARSQALHAYVVAVEHRFYGKSLPRRPNGYTIQDLRDLSSERAIEDLKEAQTQIAKLKGMTGPWFSYGISYGATLAAYYRIAHPEMAAGAFAFSPPFRISSDGLTGYELVPARAFGPELSAKVRSATDYILSQVNVPAGKAWVQKTFQLPNDRFNEVDVAAILVTIIPQFGQSGVIPQLRTALANTAPGKESAEALLRTIQARFGEDFWSESPYGLGLDAKFSTNVSRWIYQAFNEFGWMYVTTPSPAESLFSTPLKMDYYVSRLDELFHGDLTLMREAAFPQRMEKELLTRASRIAVFNGSYDPWFASSYDLNERSREISSLIIQAGKHGAGCCGVLIDDPLVPEFAAQEAVFAQLRAWSGP